MQINFEGLLVAGHGIVMKALPQRRADPYFGDATTTALCTLRRKGGAEDVLMEAGMSAHKNDKPCVVLHLVSYAV